MKSAKSWALHACLHPGQENRAPRSASISTAAGSAAWSYRAAGRPASRAASPRAPGQERRWRPCSSPRPVPPKGCHRARAGQGQAAAQTRRWPATTLDRRCARRPVRWQVGTWRNRGDSHFGRTTPSGGSFVACSLRAGQPLRGGPPIPTLPRAAHGARWRYDRNEEAIAARLTKSGRVDRSPRCQRTSRP